MKNRLLFVLCMLFLFVNLNSCKGEKTMIKTEKISIDDHNLIINFIKEQDVLSGNKAVKINNYQLLVENNNIIRIMKDNYTQAKIGNDGEIIILAVNPTNGEKIKNQIYDYVKKLIENIKIFNESYVIKYLDGNNNIYEVYSDFIRYTPVKPINSSSGFYSGGSDKIKSISADTLKEFSSLIENITNNKTLHIKDRVMMSGLIKVNDSNEVFYIKPESEDKNKIESYLSHIGNN